MPASLEVVGTNGSKSVRYGFVIKNWFIHRYAYIYNVSNSRNWCNQTVNYIIPDVKDYTNAYNSSGMYTLSPNPSSGNFWERRIGDGFFTEWGDVSKYGTGVTMWWYWASEAYATNR